MNSRLALKKNVLGIKINCVYTLSCMQIEMKNTTSSVLASQMPTTLTCNISAKIKRTNAITAIAIRREGVSQDAPY